MYSAVYFTVCLILNTVNVLLDQTGVFFLV